MKSAVVFAFLVMAAVSGTWTCPNEADKDTLTNRVGGSGCNSAGFYLYACNTTPSNQGLPDCGGGVGSSVEGNPKTYYVYQDGQACTDVDCARDYAQLYADTCY